MFKRHPGSASMQGSLYETKLISLFLFRAQHNPNIEEFYLGSNLEKVTHFDDICFKAKIKGYDRPLAVFLQVKHKEKPLTLNHVDIVKYFKGYLQIKQSFNPQSNDIFFNEYFDNTECICIFYTNATCAFKRDMVKSPFTNHLNDLISTSIVDGSQLCYPDEDVQLLETEVLKDELKILAKHFAIYIISDRNQMMMNDEYIYRYHVILARHVVQILPEGKDYKYVFRHDFFSTTDEYLSLFKDELCHNAFELFQSKQKIKQRSDKSLVSSDLIQELHINNFLSNPSEETLMNVIGSTVTYENNQLKFMTKRHDNLQKQLSLINLPYSTINRAIKTFAINRLKLLTFNLPSTFGNTDLVLVGNVKKVARRITYLADRILDMIETSKPRCIVSIDETIADGFLHLNGGLAGTVGNLLVYDDESQLLKFTDDCAALECNAKSLLTKIRDKIDDLQKYRFDITIKKFPKLKITDRYNKYLVEHFLNKLMFWTDQAPHNIVENILKDEIENYESCSKTSYFRIKSDAILLKYYDEINKWWMSPNAHYLTKHMNMYQLTANDVINNPLIQITSTMYLKKIITTEYAFNGNALELFTGKFSSPIQFIIVTNITILTILKVTQCLKKNNLIVLDLKYILGMLTDEFYALISELKNEDTQYILILVCDDLNNILPSNVKLQQFIKTIPGKETVIITNNTDVSTMNQYFSQINDVLHDEKHSLDDLSPSSQANVLNDVTVSFQGEDTTLAHLVHDLPKTFIQGSVLRKVILRECIVIGGSLTNRSYEKMPHLFINRKVTRGHDTMELESLFDIEDDIVLITGKPGMGKSTLLTYLALKTKKLNHTVWIVKICFVDHVKYFYKCKRYNTVIDKLETLKFMCRSLLQTMNPECNATINLNIESSGEVCLDLDGNDEWAIFELRLFLHFYMKGNVIFLFDGFDEITPHYTDLAMSLLNIIKDDCPKNKMWITSRFYKDIVSILESCFGTPYQLEYFDDNDLYVYLDKFWKTNLILSHFDKEQIEGLKAFLDKILAKKTFYKTILNHPLSCVYESLISYLVMNFPALDDKDRWRDLYSPMTLPLKDMVVTEGEPSASRLSRCAVKTPLLAYLCAKYFADYIKHLDDETYESFYSDIDVTTIYDRFIKTKLLKHFIDIKKVDIYNPSIVIEYETEFQKLMKLYND